MYVCWFFFFSSRRRHTRFKCDWSSDVCSSDLEISRAALADILGIADGSVEVQEGPLAAAPPQTAVGTNGVAAHPLAEAQQARVQEVRSEVHVLEPSYYPKFNLQSAVYGTASGANTTATFPAR